jgi:hypothetical protein
LRASSGKDSDEAYLELSAMIRRAAETNERNEKKASR